MMIPDHPARGRRRENKDVEMRRVYNDDNDDSYLFLLLPPPPPHYYYYPPSIP